MHSFTISVDMFVGFFAAIFLYYLVLFIVSKRNPKHRVSNSADWGFVILIPAHNEALVIEDTVRRAASLRAPAHVVVIDDGSTDGTGDIARQYLGGNVHLLSRVAPHAKQGKGEALNHAYLVAQKYYEKWFPGIPAERIIITVLDADGYLDQQLFAYVAGMLENNPRMGGVQTPVTIQHPEKSMWLRLQDLEFVGFSCFVQQARHWFSSIGLGGNGQFIRASALQKLGAKPWTPALSEDLDIGLRLLLCGQRLGYCNKGFVHQQGLTKLRPLLKQRTRWVQGHYQAWRYIPQIWRSRHLSFGTKIDLSIYLLLVAAVLVIVVNSILAGLGFLGILQPQSAIMQSLVEISPLLARFAQLLLSIGAGLFFSMTYARYSRSRVSIVAWPALNLLFCFYGWIWVYASIVALYRLARGKNNWVKTERVVFDDQQSTQFVPQPTRQ